MEQTREVRLAEESPTFAGERIQLSQMLEALEASREPVERADLAGGIVEVAARYENAKADALYPNLSGIPGSGPVLEQAALGLQAVREALAEIHNRTRHVKPINAHAGDPDGFEAAVEALISALRAHLDQEDREVLPLLNQLAPVDFGHLLKTLEGAAAHASSLPDPPHNPVRRVLAEVGGALDRTLSDQSTPWHPGLDQLDEDSAADEEASTG